MGSKERNLHITGTQIGPFVLIGEDLAVLEASTIKIQDKQVLGINVSETHSSRSERISSQNRTHNRMSG